MAGNRIEEKCSVKTLFSSLCKAVIDHEEKIEDEKWRCNPLKLPGYLQAETFKNKDHVKKHLFKTCYDLLLLQRSEWYGRWRTPLTPTCRCLAYGYHLQQAGEANRADRLMTLLDSVVMSSYDCSDSILTFLAIMSNEQTTSHRLPPQTLDKYTIYPE